MKCERVPAGRVVRRHAGWTLAEVALAMAMVSLSFASLYLGFAQGFNVTRLTRESERATQILQDDMETIRLYTWDQITNNSYIPSTFTNYYNPAGAANGTEGVIYYGTHTIADAPITESYAGDLKLFTVQLDWTSGSSQHQRIMSTLVSRYGLHNYIYSLK